MSSTSHSFQLKIQFAFSACTELVLVLLLVFLSATLSAQENRVDKITPLKSRAAKLQMNVKELEVTLQKLGSAVSTLSAKLYPVKQTLTEQETRLNAIRADTSSLSSIRESLNDASEQIEEVKTSLEVLRKNLLGDVASTVPSPNLNDEIFMTYNPSKGRPGHHYFINKDKLKDFYKDWGVKPLRTYLEKGRFEVYIPCEEILNLGICITNNRYTTVEISSALRTILKDPVSNQFLSSMEKTLAELLKKDSNGAVAIFIDLHDLLMTAYKETAPEPMACCPDDPKFDSLAATRMKLCHALQLPGGLSVLLKNSGTTKLFSIRSYASGEGPFETSFDARKIKVEPRAYVTIYEKKKRNSDVNPIWWLEKKADTIQKDKTIIASFSPQKTFGEKFYPRQRYEAVDINSILEIRFDQEALAKNVDFFGNISLAASIEGRKIEVAPYYVIGEQRRSLGVNSESVRKIANNFMRLFIEARRGEVEFQRLRSSDLFKEPPDNATIKDNLKERIGYLIEYYTRIKLQFLYADSVKLYSYIPTEIKNNIESTLLYVNSPVLYNFSRKPEFYDFGTIITELNRLNNDVNTRTAFRVNIPDPLVLNQQIARYESFLLTVKRIKEFMNFFDSSGQDSKRAFLNLSSITEVDYNQIKATINADDTTVPETWMEFSALAEESLKRSARHKIEQMGRAISRLNNFSGDLVEIMKAHGYNRNFLNIDLSKETKYQISMIYEPFRSQGIALEPQERKNLKATEFSVQNKFSEQNLDELLDNEKYSLMFNYEVYKTIRDELAQKAGKELFSKLVYATIDLAGSDVPEGSMLKISVMWYNTNGSTTESAEQGVELATAKLLVKKTGWYMEFAESALFVDRINENLARQSAVSPSNFKAAAGASMLWSYHNDFRGTTFPGRLWRWLEPSAGINVSFLDFSTEEVFEFGVGPILGFFQNRIFLMYGYNFNVKGESPSYMGIGLSFMNLFKKKEGNKTENE